MSEESNQETPAEDSFDLDTTQLILAVLFGLGMAYLSFAYVRFRQLPASRKTLVNFLVPFGETVSAETLHKKGVKKYRSGKYREAIDYFRRSLQLEPNNYKAVFLMGGALIRLKQFRQGVQLLEKVREGNPDFARVYIKQAYVLLGLGQYARASEMADRYLERSGVPPSNKVYAYLVKISSNLLADDRPAAPNSQLFEKARSLGLPDTSLPMRLVDLLSGDGSVEALLQSGMSNGEKTEVRTWGAIRLLAEGQKRQAVELLQWVLREGDPHRYEYDIAVAVLSRGSARRRSGR